MIPFYKEVIDNKTYWTLGVWKNIVPTERAWKFDGDLCTIRTNLFGDLVANYYEFSDINGIAYSSLNNFIISVQSFFPIPSNASTTVEGEKFSGTAERSVGGIIEGMVFNNYTMADMWNQLIKQEKYPILTNPSLSFVSSITGLREVGENISLITFVATFNRGSIVPQYTALNAFRSGLPNLFTYIGTGLSNKPSTDLIDTNTISNYTVLINTQSWLCNVSYDEGVQPKSSYDNNYNIALPQGTTNTITNTIIGVYPLLATTNTINSLTKQSLLLMNSNYFELDMVAESGLNKQTVDIPAIWATITGVQYLNTISNTWEWIKGSKINSLTTFNIIDVTNTIQSLIVNYKRWTNNDVLTGARKLRFFTI